jgi:flagellar assembly protein FliH
MGFAMGSPAKFLFDTDFAAAERVKSSIALAEHSTKLAEAEATGYRNGVGAGKAQAEARAGAAFERIAAALDGLRRSLAAVEERLEAEAIGVAVAVARKLAPELIAREPFAEISALATNCFRQLVAAPHVVVRVNDRLHPSAREQLDQAVEASGFAGRLVVLAEPDIAPGDCRIEWADGGVKRDRAATEAAIDDAVARYIAARRGEPHMPEISWRPQS